MGKSALHDVGLLEPIRLDDPAGQQRIDLKNLSLDPRKHEIGHPVCCRFLAGAKWPTAFCHKACSRMD